MAVGLSINLAVNFGGGGDAESKSEAFCEYFRGKTVPFSDGRTVVLKMERMMLENAEWVVGIFPEGVVEEIGSKLPESPLKKDAAQFFYREIKGAPLFEYAWFGVEAYDLFKDEDCTMDIMVDPEFPGKGMVVSNRLWEKMEEPDYYEEFSSKYKWMPMR